MAVLNAPVDAPFPSFQSSILPIFRSSGRAAAGPFARGQILDDPEEFLIRANEKSGLRQKFLGPYCQFPQEITALPILNTTCKYDQDTFGRYLEGKRFACLTSAPRRERPQVDTVLNHC